MPRCTRCNEPFELRLATDRRCPRCEAEVRDLTAPKAEPAFLPTWRRRPFGKVLDHGHGRAVA